MGWFILAGFILLFIGIIVASFAAESYDAEIGVVVGLAIIAFGIVLASIGGFGISAESKAADAAGIKQVTAAAEAQGLVITDQHRSGATVIGDKCILDADLVDDKLVLSGSDPAIVLTPDYVDLVCQGTAQ